MNWNLTNSWEKMFSVLFHKVNAMRTLREFIWKQKTSLQPDTALRPTAPSQHKAQLEGFSPDPGRPALKVRGHPMLPALHYALSLLNQEYSQMCKNGVQRCTRVFQTVMGFTSSHPAAVSFTSSHPAAVSFTSSHPAAVQSLHAPADPPNHGGQTQIRADGRARPRHPGRLAG